MMNWLRQLWRRLRRWLASRRRRHAPPTLPAIPPLPEPPVPRPLRLAADEATRRCASVVFACFFSPAQNVWGLTATHGRQRATRFVSDRVARGYPPNLIERWAYELCLEMARELGCFDPCPRNVPIPCHEAGPLHIFLADVERKHRPDGLACDDEDGDDW